MIGNLSDDAQIKEETQLCGRDTKRYSLARTIKCSSFEYESHHYYMGIEWGSNPLVVKTAVWISEKYIYAGLTYI